MTDSDRDLVLTTWKRRNPRRATKPKKTGHNEAECRPDCRPNRRRQAEAASARAEDLVNTSGGKLEEEVQLPEYLVPRREAVEHARAEMEEGRVSTNACGYPPAEAMSPATTKDSASWNPAPPLVAPYADISPRRPRRDPLQDRAVPPQLPGRRGQVPV